jgi:preprotein translocase subunit SecA
MRDSFIDDFFDDYQIDFSQFDEEKKEKIKDGLKNNLNIDLEFNSFKNIQNIQLEDLINEVKKLSNNNINLKKTKYTEEVFLIAQKSLLLQIIDKSWKDHLLSLDHLRQGISLRAYGQKDPLNEYKQEAFLMFEEMMRQIRETVSKIISFIEIKSEVPEPSSKIPEQNKKVIQGKVPRNAKCPCGSGKKYKHCCGKLN